MSSTNVSEGMERPLFGRHVEYLKYPEISDDTTLARKARTHRKDIDIQIAMIETTIDTLSDLDLLEFELQAAEVMEQLLKEELILEARRLAILIAPDLHKRYAEHQVKAHLLNKFPDEEELESLL